MIDLRQCNELAYPSTMPYVFPYENVFIGGVSLVIMTLLILRLKVARYRRLLTTKDAHEDTPQKYNANIPPLV